MVTFYDFPKAHWKHLRTTNIIESPFAAVRLRTAAAKRYKKVRQCHRGDLEDPDGGGIAIPAPRCAASGGRSRGRSRLRRRGAFFEEQERKGRRLRLFTHL